MPYPSYPQLAQRAFPFILANCAAPLLGIVDTAVIGNFGSVEDLGAIALGSLIFTFIYFAFGFLRMSTTGYVAQAYGANDDAEIRAVLGLALILAALISLLLLALRPLLISASFAIFSASDAVETTAAQYLQIRLLGTPASFALMAIFAVLIGTGNSRQLMWLQFFLNGCNMGLDYLFAAVWGYGAVGIAYGTVIAEWTTLALSFYVVYRQLTSPNAPFWPVAKLRDLTLLRQMLSANRDIMIRTVLMLFAFGVFTNSGAAMGDQILAANHILLQLITFSAFFLDGFAYVTEAEVGQAKGANNLQRFDNAVKRCSVLAAATACGLALLFTALAGPLIRWIADDPTVVATTIEYLPYCTLYIVLSVAAFQLDGIFIGAIRGGDMRNASVLAVTAFLSLWWLVSADSNPQALWLSFVCYVIFRALALGLFYPRLRASISV